MDWRWVLTPASQKKLRSTQSGKLLFQCLQRAERKCSWHSTGNSPSFVVLLVLGYGLFVVFLFSLVLIRFDIYLKQECGGLRGMVRGEGVHRCQLSQLSSPLARNKRPEINLVMAAINICKVKSLIRQRNLEQSENWSVTFQQIKISYHLQSLSAPHIPECNSSCTS